MHVCACACACVRVCMRACNKLWAGLGARHHALTRRLLDPDKPSPTGLHFDVATRLQGSRTLVRGLPLVPPFPPPPNTLAAWDPVCQPRILALSPLQRSPSAARCTPSRPHALLHTLVWMWVWVWVWVWVWRGVAWRGCVAANSERSESGGVRVQAVRVSGASIPRPLRASP